MTAVAGGHDGARLRHGQRRRGQSGPDRQRDDRLVHEQHVHRRAGLDLGGDSRSADGTVDATAFPQGPLAAGLLGFKAHYLGDRRTVYAASDGPCEPLRVVDANIQITPTTATNRVGPDAHVHGARQRERRHRLRRTRPPARRSPSRSTPAPARSRRRARAPRSAATGSCTVDLTSADDRRHDRQRAHDGDRRRRRADPRHERHGAATPAPATKTWVDAKITIAPTRRTGSASRTPSRSPLKKDIGDGRLRRRCRRARRRHADGRERRRAHGSDRHLHHGRREHERERPVHDHLHLEHGGQGDRRTRRRRCRSAAGTGHGRRPTASRRTRPTRSRRSSTPTSRSRRRRRTTRSAPTHVFTAHVNVNTGNGTAS